MSEAKKLGFKLKVHADEIESFGGAELAAELGAVSAEHLMAISEQGIEALAKSGTVAVVLPATSFFLMAPQYAPAKKMIESGVCVAIATDYNPGSSPTENIQQAMWNACFKMKLSPEQIFRGVTINAAKAICRERIVGSLEKGKQADLLVLNAPSLEYALYHFGVNSVRQVWKQGKKVHEVRD